VRLLLAGVLVALVAGPALPGERPAAEVWPRVTHHLDEINRLSAYFEGLVREGCPRFATPAEWDTYLDGELRQVVLLVAHVEQAWVEAKTTDDDDVRRAAKAPRRRVPEARSLVDKLAGCAEANGTRLQMNALWQRVEQDVPRAQADITLPR
jgi:hypothetical protein